MPTNSPRAWWLHSVTLVVWALVAASAVFWALKFVPAPGAPTAQPIDGSGAASADPAAVARLLGATDAVVPVAHGASAARRYVLLGVVADREHRGAALIAVDGKPPKPFRVGAAVDTGLLLQSVAPRRALLGPSLDAPASLTLDLPVPTTHPTNPINAPAANTLPAAVVPPGSAIAPERFLAPSATGAPPSIGQRQGAPGAEIGR